MVCKEQGRWVLRGVASWTGDKKCKTDNYSMYARVTYYLNWIKDKIASKLTIQQTYCRSDRVTYPNKNYEMQLIGYKKGKSADYTN